MSSYPSKSPHSSSSFSSSSSATCLLIIPPRTGLLLLTPLTCLLSSLASSLLILTTTRPRSAALLLSSSSPGLRAALGGLLAAHITVASCSVLGFAGALTRKGVLVKVYATVLHVHWVVGLAIGLGFGLRSLLSHPEQRVARCVTRQIGLLRSQDQEGHPNMSGTASASLDDGMLRGLVHKECHGSFKLFITLFLGTVVLYHIVALYFLFVAHRGAAELRRAELAGERNHDNIGDYGEEPHAYLDEEAKSPQVRVIGSVGPPVNRRGELDLEGRNATTLPAITRRDGTPPPTWSSVAGAPSLGPSAKQPLPYQQGRSLASMRVPEPAPGWQGGEAASGSSEGSDWTHVGLHSASTPRVAYKSQYPWR
ncbi:hypothetical protein BDZ90DRAFT_98475 [Jaminaea rosea]|uniref:Uncharacterized protein n=1 Tax=Jaminaea rosea TaxID=1569628 RepID=A0A316UKR8_9BASI|nr:hypothetical protein BDZ90DRAFT_98475 [Jaminaea rosea]PWN24523.1 hypothetical protein BDZ90DRAFT_98475 [Jaminaea rosea]